MASRRNPLTFLIEAADDIVYSVADIEDGVKKGILTWDALRNEITKDGGGVVTDTLKRLDKILKAGRAQIPPGLPDDVYVSAFRTAAIATLVPSVLTSFKDQYDAIMDGRYNGELIADCHAAPLVKCLKKIGRDRVYCTPPTLKLELMGRKVIGDLMDIFWEGAKQMPLNDTPKTKSFPGKVAALLSENYRRVFQNSVNRGLPEIYSRFQLVTDYVCGMTDSFATRLHAELSNGI